MDKGLIIAQINTLKIQLEAMNSQLDFLLEMLIDYQEQEPETEICTHPVESRINLSTMGIERWQCRVCGYQYEGGD